MPFPIPTSLVHACLAASEVSPAPAHQLANDVGTMTTTWPTVLVVIGSLALIAVAIAVHRCAIRPAKPRRAEAPTELSRDR